MTIPNKHNDLSERDGQNAVAGSQPPYHEGQWVSYEPKRFINFAMSAKILAILPGNLYAINANGHLWTAEASELRP